MPAPLVSTNFGDLLLPDFNRIVESRFKELPDFLPDFYTVISSSKNIEKFSSVGDAGDWSEFTGLVSYDSLNQGFDVTATHIEFASGFQVERKLYDDDQYNIINKRPAALATAAQRTRQKHAARMLNNAFSVDSYFYQHSEGVALCSNSHATTAPGVSTAAGFDNLGTSAFSAIALQAARIAMVGFRNDRGDIISIMPDELWFPVDLYGQVYEVLNSMGKPDTANNNVNVHKGSYTPHEWNYLTDTNNWFLTDSTMRKDSVKWIERVPMEFAQAEDIDTLTAKYRGYMRYSNVWEDWRFIHGFQVS